MALTIEDFGGRVATIWSELRPTTRKLVEHALQPLTLLVSPARNAPYDARADLELSKLLAALDEGASETVAPGHEKSERLRQVADTCAAMLQERTQSAEVFVQLVERAQARHDYKRIDALADALMRRFAASEICELARSQNNVVRALAEETLAQLPTPLLIGLLQDPLDAEVGRQALQRQAREFGVEHAQDVVSALDQIDLNSEDI